MTGDDRVRADVLGRLMCDFVVDVAQICVRNQVEPDELMHPAPRLQPLVNDGFVQLEGNIVRMAANARVLVGTIAAAFDAHLTASNRIYSRAV